MLIYRRQAEDLRRQELRAALADAAKPPSVSAAAAAAAALDPLASQPSPSEVTEEKTGKDEEVRGAAGSMAAALKLASARVGAKAAGKGSSNWLVALGAHHGRQKIKRAPVAAPVGGVVEAVNLGVGVTMSQMSGKMHFPVLYKFYEGYTNAVKRPLSMTDISKPSSAQQ